MTRTILLFFTMAAHCFQLVGQNSTPPNILLIMADDLGWGDTGYNGHPTLQTPCLDKMAEEGIRFDRFYSAGPVCSPTRGSVLTGRHPFRYGIYNANAGHMKREEFTLSEALKTKGYTTGHFGKWHLGTLTTQTRDSNRGRPGEKTHYSPPWENGFDVCFSTEAKVPTYDPMWQPQTGASQSGWSYLKAEEEKTPYGTCYWEGPGLPVKEDLDGDDSRIIMDRVLPFISQSVAAKKPFFGIVWFHAPHLPVVAGPEHLALYSEGDEHTRNYFGCISAMDQQIGRLRRHLTDLGADANTMIWFCSDNGPEGQPGKAPGHAGPFRGRKRSLYEGGIRVPGLLVWPEKIKSPRVVTMPCVTSDYFPTILETVGFPLPTPVQPLDGISLLPLLRGEMKARPFPIAFQSNQQIALSDNRFKLYSPDQGNQWELYDLIEDPSESVNLNEEMPETLNRMSKVLHRWISSCEESDMGKDYLVR